jgi:hypothetical protein
MTVARKITIIILHSLNLIILLTAKINKIGNILKKFKQIPPAI